jgi:polygalacturonase
MQQSIRPTHQFLITDYGAVNNGAVNCDEAINASLRACREAGGGSVVVPPGRYLCGPIRLASNIDLHLAAGAHLLFSQRFDDYPPVPTRWEGVECYGYHPLIYGFELENVSITGRGVLDGRGEPWWKERRRRLRERVTTPLTEQDRRLAVLNPGYETAGGGGGGRESQFLRPPLIQLMHCENVMIDGVTCGNSPFWNTHLVYCRNAHVRDVTFFNPDDAPNGDGLDIDSCTGVSVQGCTFDMGDDCIVIKSGCDTDGRRVDRPCEDIVIANCLLLRGHGGIVFGSESAAGIRNVTVTNCIFRGTDRGVRFKSRRGRGGTIEDVRISNLIMREVRCPLVMNLYYHCGIREEERDVAFSEKAHPVGATTPCLRNIHLSDVTSRDTRAAGAILIGLPECPITGVSLDNVVISLDTEATPTNPAMAHGIGAMNRTGIIGRYLERLAVRNVTIEGARGSAVSLTDVKGCGVDTLNALAVDDAPLIHLTRARGVRVVNCVTADGETAVVAADEENCEEITVDGTKR